MPVSFKANEMSIHEALSNLTKRVLSGEEIELSRLALDFDIVTVKGRGKMSLGTLGRGPDKDLNEGESLPAGLTIKRVLKTVGCLFFCELGQEKSEMEGAASEGNREEARKTVREFVIADWLYV